MSLPRLPKPPVSLPEARRRKLVSREVPSTMEAIVETVDDITETLVGGRPAERVAKLLVHISPAATWKRLTGLPTPGEFIDSIADRVAMQIEELERRIFPGADKAAKLEKEILS